MNAPILDRGACNAGNVHANAVLLTHICAGSIPATNPQTGACTGKYEIFCFHFITKNNFIVLFKKAILDPVYTAMID